MRDRCGLTPSFVWRGSNTLSAEWGRGDRLGAGQQGCRGSVLWILQTTLLHEALRRPAPPPHTHTPTCPPAEATRPNCPCLRTATPHLTTVAYKIQALCVTARTRTHQNRLAPQGGACRRRRQTDVTETSCSLSGPPLPNRSTHAACSSNNNTNPNTLQARARDPPTCIRTRWLLPGALAPSMTQRSLCIHSQPTLNTHCAGRNPGHTEQPGTTHTQAAPCCTQTPTRTLNTRNHGQPQGFLCMPTLILCRCRHTHGVIHT